MTTETKTAPDPLNFDEVFLNAPSHLEEYVEKRELREMRADASLLINQQVETFCRELVLNGRIPTKAYEIAFSVEDVELGQWVKPDNPSWQASKLLRLPEVIARIREIRDEVIHYGGMIERGEVIANLKSIAFDPHAKHSDRLAASKQLAQMEAMERAPDAPAGATIQIVLPFAPQPLRTVSSTIDSLPPPDL